MVSGRITELCCFYKAATQYLEEWVGLCSDKTLFMDTVFCFFFLDTVLYNFGPEILFFEFVFHLFKNKKIILSLALQKQVVGLDLASGQ